MLQDFLKPSHQNYSTCKSKSQDHPISIVGEIDSTCWLEKCQIPLQKVEIVATIFVNDLSQALNAY